MWGMGILILAGLNPLLAPPAATVLWHVRAPGLGEQHIGLQGPVP